MVERERENEVEGDNDIGGGGVVGGTSGQKSAARAESLGKRS